MSLDGIVLKAISHELSALLCGGRVDKVHQPERDELIVQIRNAGVNYKLLISASSSNPRVHLTEYSKKNPQAPPMFCMLLRKHIQGGKIISISQPSFERVLRIEIESLDELGDLTSKELIVEIMGKHSNIILTKLDSNKILDSIKRVPISVSAVRQILPGLTYEAPPAQDKFDPGESSEADFDYALSSTEPSLPIYKFLYTKFVGMSPLIAKELCSLGAVDIEKPVSALENSEIKTLYSKFKNFYDKIALGEFHPTVIKDQNDLEVLAFSAVELTQFEGYPKEEFQSMSKLLEYFFFSKDNSDRIKQKSSELRKNVMLKLERLLNKAEKQRLELIDSEKRESFKIKGDLLTANIYKIQKGDSSVVVQNFYSEALEDMEIKLDLRLSPSDNAQKYYKKYTKLKTAAILVSEQLAKSEEEIDYLQNIVYSIDNCTEVQEIDEIKEELVNEGYFKKSSFKKKKASTEVSKPYQFNSSDGFMIFVGKNNKQNDELTLKFASKEDLWFHTKDIPGSHVIVKTNGAEVPENTIFEAALLAAFYSKANQSSNVPVDYALKKYVKKPSGAKPGRVIYENNHTAYVTPDKLTISKIKKVELN